MSLELDFIKEEVEKFNESIRSDLNSKRLSDTGKAAESLRVETNEKEGKVLSIGSEHLEYLNRGTRPWQGDEKKNTNILNFILIKSGWADRKFIKNPYMIAKSIVTKGSAIHRGEKEGIELEEKVEKLTQSLLNGLPSLAKQSALVTLTESFKK